MFDTIPLSPYVYKSDYYTLLQTVETLEDKLNILSLEIHVLRLKLDPSYTFSLIKKDTN